jgi:DNA modification methylase
MEIALVCKSTIEHDQIVLDSIMGSGTTGIAALNIERKFIGVELTNKSLKLQRRTYQKR